MMALKLAEGLVQYLSLWCHNVKDLKIFDSMEFIITKKPPVITRGKRHKWLVLCCLNQTWHSVRNSLYQTKRFCLKRRTCLAFYPGAIPWQHGGGQPTGFSLPEKKKVLEKGGHGAKEGRVGAADISLLLIAAKWKGPQGQRFFMDYSSSPQVFKLLQFSQCRVENTDLLIHRTTSLYLCLCKKLAPH